MKPILGILGATGAGKSAVAVEVALLLKNARIISADSMQIYRNMDVGTAKITAPETKGVPHYLIDVVNPDESFSAFDFVKLAKPIIEDGSDNVNVVVGGTGLYFDSLLHGLDFSSNEQTLQIRNSMTELLQNKGPNAVLDVLKTLSIDTYNNIDKNNLKRVIRAIEILSIGENPLEKSSNRLDLYPNVLFVLNRDRQDTYNRINLRVDKMVQDGLLEEVRSLYTCYKDKNLQSFKAIGYKEVIAHLDGEITFEQAVDTIKISTRRYAKRQNTYFKRMQNTVWIDVDGKTSAEIAAIIVAKYNDFCKNLSN